MVIPHTYCESVGLRVNYYCCFFFSLWSNIPFVVVQLFRTRAEATWRKTRAVNLLSSIRLRVQSHNFFSCLIIIGIIYFIRLFPFYWPISFVVRRIFAQTQIPIQIIGCHRLTLQTICSWAPLFRKSETKKWIFHICSMYIEIEMNSQPTGARIE